MKTNFQARARLISTVTLLLSMLLIGRLYSVQIVSGDAFAAKAERQYLNNNYSLFDRGTIYFENKDGTLVSAATLKSGFTLAVNPMAVEGAEATYERLSKAIQLDRKSFIERAQKPNDPYEEIAKRLDGVAAKKIEDLKLPGVSVYREKWRIYPGESMAAHALGFVGYKGDEFGGRYGLENYYDDVLRRSGEGEYVNFFAEMFSNIREGMSETSQREGDIITTIEPTVQAFLERELGKVNEKYSSTYSGGIVIDPKTGEIVAMAIDPAYDPNDLKSLKDSSRLSNKLVENVYEMGSIVKPLTVAAGLDSGAITAATTYYDAGSIWLNTKQISNYDGKARGVVPMQEVLNQSLNTGVTFIVQRMGKQKFAKYMLDFGIGQETGIDLPNEAHGLVENLASPREIEYATASFGQGIAMTPIATVRALSVLANGGTLVTPHLVKKVRYKSGITKEIAIEEGKRVLKPETSEEISRMLVGVVDTALRGGTLKIANHSVAAKTGTAEIASAGGYYEDRYLHSFFGYFPAYDAKFLVFLYTVEPKGVKYASETLTDSFMDITKYLINYYEIPPDR